ncbi:hypothetical protein NP493_1249g00064 [Ridgeia piscesae]|uniref:Uncharacterized protein n=1 Tax=Ridgeia piscesae TaxID=27915 RepID=A0AAD9NGR4_RIDPI|nr:hypothetical protein NP493_1249g00064 [Ridgeia piscesae]
MENRLTETELRPADNKDTRDNDSAHEGIGFAKGKRRSCEFTLIQPINNLVKYLNEGGQIDAVLLDFLTPFDTVPHH